MSETIYGVKSLTVPSLETFAREKLARLEAGGLLRSPQATQPLGGAALLRSGRRLLSFSSNDYLGLRDHPAVRAAAIAAIEEEGTGAGAAALITGTGPYHAALEARLAAFKGTAATCLFGSGYLANVGTIPALAGPEDLLLLDELSHACLRQGARLASGTVLTFRHNDTGDLLRQLKRHRRAHRHALVITEGVFSMDGDIAPLFAIGTLAHAYDAWLVVDDAHGTGVLAEGRGTAYVDAAAALVDVQMGTLSKAFASYGGYVCASEAVVELLRNRARSYVYSTALPPASVAAALAALSIVEREPARTRAPLAHAGAFTHALGLEPATTPIVPLILGTTTAAMNAAADLEAQGFLVVPIRPPTVPADTARLRFSFSAAHSADDVVRVAAAAKALAY